MLSGSTLLRHLAQFYCAIYNEEFCCARSITDAYWGQALDIDFQTKGVEHVYISPPPHFGYKPVALAIESDNGFIGSINMFADDGDIRIRMLTRDGRLLRQQIAITTKAVDSLFEELEEDDNY